MKRAKKFANEDSPVILKEQCKSFENYDISQIAVNEIQREVRAENWEGAIAACNKLKRKELGDNVAEKELDLCSNLQQLAERFATVSSFEITLRLFHCQLGVIKTSPTNVSTRQKQLNELATAVTNVVRKKTKNDIADQQLLCLMDEIWSEMQTLEDKEAERKCQNLLKILSRFTECCVLLHQSDKAMELIKKAIFFLKLLFGERLTILAYPHEVHVFGGNNSKIRDRSGGNFWIFYSGSENIIDVKSKLEAD